MMQVENLCFTLSDNLGLKFVTVAAIPFCCHGYQQSELERA